MPIVTVAGVVRESGLAPLRARRDIELRVLPDPTPAALREVLPTTTGLLLRTSRLTADLIAAAPELRIVSRHGVGYDNVDVPALDARRIPLAIAATSNMVSVAEHAFWMLLELVKHGRAIDAAMRGGDWGARDRLRPREVSGKELLVVGFGRIGSRVAARARAFDMRVLVVDPFISDAAVAAAGCEPIADLGTGLERADAVTLHCPLSTATRHMIDSTALARLKPSAVLINTARGSLVDEAALAAALSRGEIAGAGVDAFEAEPPPPDHPLLRAPNALLTPHNAGVTVESAERMARESALNILAAFDGTLDPALVVNADAIGYRRA